MSNINADIITELPSNFYYLLENYGYTATASSYATYIENYRKNKFLSREQIRELEAELKEFFEKEKLLFCDGTDFPTNIFDFHLVNFEFEDATNTISATYVWDYDFLDFSKKLGNVSPTLDKLGPAAFAMPTDFYNVVDEFAKLVKNSDKNAKKPELAKLILSNLDELNGISSNITGNENLDQLLIFVTNTQFGVALVKAFFLNVINRTLSTNYRDDVLDIYLSNIMSLGNKNYAYDTEYKTERV